MSWRGGSRRDLARSWRLLPPAGPSRAGLSLPKRRALWTCEWARMRRTDAAELLAQLEVERDRSDSPRVWRGALRKSDRTIDRRGAESPTDRHVGSARRDREGGDPRPGETDGTPPGQKDISSLTNRS